MNNNAPKNRTDPVPRAWTPWGSIPVSTADPALEQARRENRREWLRRAAERNND